MFKKKVQNINTKKVEFWISNDGDFSDRKHALELFDMLGYNSNIAVDVFRAYDDKEDLINSFKEKNNCKIIRNVTRNDCFCIFIPELKSNLMLFELIAAMDIQTEWNYIPFVADLDSLLYSLESLTQKSIIEHNVSKFQAIFDGDFGLHFYFDTKYYAEEAENTLNEWERTLQKLDYKKVKM